MSDSSPAPWWRTAVIYQVYPRSFADASGDGIGDLPGITARLDHIARLGADAVWLSPFYVSPQNDAGYDVADYCDVDPMFGTLADAEALIARAHELGLRVIVDVVPNHSSSEHEWFQAALAAGPGSRERARYIFREGKGEGGNEPPNNWLSMFGGSAWERVTEADGTPGQWYLHLFDKTQPDFDWTNPEVADMFDSVMAFWLDRGADGFRVDVAHGLAKDPSFADIDVDPLRTGGEWAGSGHPYWSRDEVHEIWRRWRKVADAYDGDRALVAEAWVDTLDRMALYTRPDEFQQAFNFSYLMTRWNAPAVREVIDASLAAFGAVGAPSTWVLSNHDTIRHTTRLALANEQPHAVGVGPLSEDQPDEDFAIRRGRAATMVMLALPGSAYIYQGEELGLPEAIDIADEARQDPLFFGTPEGVYGRDGCRVPLPWEADAPAFGFSPTGESWLPQPAHWGEFAADAQDGVEGSTLEMYRHAIRTRAAHQMATGTVTWNAADDDALDFTVAGVRVVANMSGADLPVPEGEVIASSGPVTDTIPPDTTVWLAS